MDGVDNRRAWDIASRKYVEESDAFLDEAADATLLEIERDLLAPLLNDSVVVHLQSGNGLDDPALHRLGASTVVGVDFSAVTATAAQRRADALEVPVGYVAGDALNVPIRSASVDLVYTGKGSLMWLSDLTTWAAECARVVRRHGHLFLYDAHPAAALWTWDEDRADVRSDRSYFRASWTNDNFPASAIERFSPNSGDQAVEWQWTLADVVSAALGAGFQLRHLGEYPEPFWLPGGTRSAAAWAGNLPNSFSLLAVRTT